MRRRFHNFARLALRSGGSDRSGRRCARRRDRRARRHRTAGHHPRQLAHRVDRRRDHRDPLCARARAARRRRRFHELLSAAGAAREAERRLHAGAVAGGRARAQSVADPRHRRRRPEGNRRGAAGRRHSVRAGAGQAHRQGHPRQDRDRRDRRRRAPSAAHVSPRQSPPISRRSRRSAARSTIR